MPLRRKTSGRKTSNSSDQGTPNGKIETLMIEKPDIIRECDFHCLPSSQDKQHQQRRSSSRSDSYTSTDEKAMDGKVRRGSTGSAPFKGVTWARKTSRECPIPELNLSDTPGLTIEDCGYVDTKRGSRPITLQRLKNEDTECISIQELSGSPHRYGVKFGVRKPEPTENLMSRLSVVSASSVDSDSEHPTFQPPSSPLLVAMRTAVDSLNQYEDFEILDEIGAGFFAQVFKVSWSMYRLHTEPEVCNILYHDTHSPAEF
jgi:hypothetical protein